jgi:hypothetical protein
MSYLLVGILLWVLISLIIVMFLEAILNYKIELKFLWFNFWIGVYYDREKKIIYVNSLPCIVWKCVKKHDLV